MRRMMWKTGLGILALLAFAVPAQAAEYTVKMVSSGDKGS
jgi:hypothetical protein